MKTSEQKKAAAAAETKIENYEFEPIKGYPMLNWKGKRPFTSTQFFPAQLKENYGKPAANGWLNRIYWGDNIQVMSHLLKEFRGKIDLAFIDPPFDSKATYKKTVNIKKSAVSSDHNSFEDKQYSDIWSNDEYLQFMFDRIVLLRELLSEKGVLALHCDWHKSHQLRCIIDEIFGPDRFQNEIVWHYYNKMQGNINRFASNHDVILIYSKNQSFTFNKIREKREQPVQQIKRVWSKETQSLVNAKDENGNVIYINSTHKTIDDVWKLPMLQPADKIEPLDYPTRKPEALAERIIVAFSNPGDLVFDCFMGSGTAQAVAMKYGRRFIGNDINLNSVSSTIRRLLQVRNDIEGEKKYLPLIKNGLYQDDDESNGENEDYRSLIQEYYTGISLYHVNHYDLFRNPSEAKEILLNALEVTPVANSIYDGEKDGRLVKIMPVNRIASRADLSELISGFDYKAFEKRQKDSPNKVVEKILLVCMGHEPDLAAFLEKEVPYKIDVEVVDILRDKSELQFKRDAEAKVAAKKGKLIIEKFFPMNLLQKLSLQKEKVGDWRELVESILIDWNYDGAVLEPSMIDIPGKNDLVKGEYDIPKDAGTIRVKITDLLSESLEIEVLRG
ncbi:MAG: site-specific DNA-methyltransferase [Bdellovibrionaceae bacterium]|nr:site-specific DNA-methyltransferase [Pseudobdellovibrionaceae bacterium]